MTRWNNEVANPVRRLAFYFALVYIWLRYSMMHEMITYLVGVNLKFVYIVAPPALLGVALTGGLARTFQQRPAWYWLPFTGWMILAIPFSTWRGGSADVVFGFLKAQIGLLFVMGGLAMTWKECRKIIYALALAAVFNLLTGEVFLEAGNATRLSGFGTMGNSNDYAAHLMVVLPCALFVALGPNKHFLLRGAALATMAYGLHHILATGSRGAMVAIAATALFVFWRGTVRHRLILAVLIPIGMAAAGALLPQATLNRLTAFTDETEADIGAVYSRQAREYLLRQSIRFTVQHPVFGVGPGQFMNFEGKTSMEEGRRGAWLSTHNIFTQVSSEFGMPGLILFMAALVGTFWVFDETLRQARRRQLEEVAFGVFCLMVSFVAFSVAATFLNLAYGFYFPAFTGLAVALYSAVQRDPELVSSPMGRRAGAQAFGRFGARTPRLKIAMPWRAAAFKKRSVRTAAGNRSESVQTPPENGS